MNNIDLPVGFLTDALVRGVTFLFVVQLVVGHIDRVAVLAVRHRAVRLVGGFIDRLYQDIIHISSVTSWTIILSILRIIE